MKQKMCENFYNEPSGNRKRYLGWRRKRDENIKPEVKQGNVFI